MEGRFMQSSLKRILIVSASIGSGHQQAAQAVARQIACQHPQAKVEIVDFMAEESSYFNTLLKETYLTMLSLSPNMYDFLYRWTHIASTGSPVQNLLAVVMKKTMEKLIIQYRPQLIICTHPFPCAAAAYLKRNGKISATLAAVVTDFTVHRLWVYQEVDLYFIGTSEMRLELQKYGIASRRTHVTGIPISADFQQCFNKQTILQELQLSSVLPTLLIMGGGLGLGGVEQALASIAGCTIPLQVLVITGNNHKLRESLASHMRTSKHRIRVIGFSNRIPDLMACADLLITKPGALTISEALVSKLPMILFESIPGQEKDNAAYLAEKGAALWLKNSNELSVTVQRLLSSPLRLQAMQAVAENLQRPYAAEHIVEIIDTYLNRQSVRSAANL
jgi:processive 1,2-diacylglycerol beta-glucosyltransferase